MTTLIEHAHQARSDFQPIAVSRVQLDAPLQDLVVGQSLDGTPYTRARVLVLWHGKPLGVVWIDTEEGVVPRGSLVRAILDDLGETLREHLGIGDDREVTVERLLAAAPAARKHGSETSVGVTPPQRASVVLCTRGRPASLPHAIDSILANDHDDFELLVVDNDPSDPRTAELVALRYADDPRVRLVPEPRPGLSCARNRGLVAASSDLVVFTDDDVIVHSTWLSQLTDEFADPAVGCVTGLVEPAQLETRSQWWFECAAGFGRGVRRVAYRVDEAPHAAPLFPYQLGAYGTGASMAMRRSALMVGWTFDEALGAGSPAQGGEDIDLFLDVLLGGGTLVYQPTALSFHTHRADDAGLEKQMRGYGAGLTALLTKRLLRRPDERRLLLSRIAAGVRHALSAEFRSGGAEESLSSSYPRAMQMAEFAGMARGPFAYWRGCRASR